MKYNIQYTLTANFMHFNSSAVIVRSQLACLLPVGMFNLMGLFEQFVSLALKGPTGKQSIKYTFTILWRIVN